MRKLKQIPQFCSITAARKFWETHDVTQYQTKSISLRLAVYLLERIKVEANRRDVPYQFYDQRLARRKCRRLTTKSQVLV